MLDYSVLARSYHTLDYENKLRKTLTSFYQKNLFSHLPKEDLHKKINSDLVKYYFGEEVLKYRLAKYYLKKNYVAAFEVNVKSSRADFLVINGDSKCFEIKSKIDSLSRLNKQVDDYKNIFEYNTVLIDEKHLSSIRDVIPDFFGIWIFNRSKRVVVREAIKSPYLDSKGQIELLTKKELVKYFATYESNIILNEFDSEQINYFFKNVLKNRYMKRWNFVRDNWKAILPIDLQFFFNTNVSPELIYKG